MSKIIDETGKRYGRWIVLGRANNRRGGQAAWLCECECGIKKRVDGTHLRSGKSKSCGCLRKLQEGEAALNYLIASWKRGAKRHRREWKLSKEQVRFLTKQPCHYCGREPKQRSYGATYHGVYLYNGLDRVDNDVGYLLSNVVPCCKHCNRAKRTRSYDDFTDWVTAVFEHLSVKPQVNCGV